MTKSNKTLLIISLVLVFSISITISFVSLHNSVHAEELTNNSVLNFNQLVLNANINRTYSKSNVTPITNTNLNIVNHKFYIHFNKITEGIVAIGYNNGTSNVDLTAPSTTGSFDYFFTIPKTNYFSVYSVVDNLSITNFNIIDLTQCFGAGNEPINVADFKSYFNNDYYAYTSSTLISLSTLDAYTNGVNDTLSNLTYSFTAVDSYNRITNANVKINNISYDSTLNKTTLGSDFVSLGVPGSTQNGVLYFPFSTTLNAGDTISLTGYYGYAVFGSGSYSVDIVIVNGDSYSIIDTSTKTGSTINDLKYVDNLSFTLPYSCSGIYFICEGAGVYVSNFTISLQVFNFQSLINDAYKAGQDSVDTASIESEAYQKGKQEGIALKGDNVWSNANEFIKNVFVGIFDILSIELLPNVSLGTFVVIPLVFSVLFFIVKVAKGGD